MYKPLYKVLIDKYKRYSILCAHEVPAYKQQTACSSFPLNMLKKIIIQHSLLLLTVQGNVTQSLKR